jgi:hypothetical protein
LRPIRAQLRERALNTRIRPPVASFFKGVLASQCLQSRLRSRSAGIISRLKNIVG